MKLVKVNLKDNSYDITIRRHGLSKLASGIIKHFPTQRAVLVTNSKIAELYKKKVEEALSSRLIIDWIVIPDGERFKTLATVEKIYHQLIKIKADRKTGLVALGGGVVGDIVGFVAATYLRGVPFIQVPTTLLSQVDSSVGGKTGVDLKSGKNLVGAFYQPKWVLIDTDFLETLPKREFKCGMAEVIKYGLMWDKSFFDFLKQNHKEIIDLQQSTIEFIIGRSCEIKADIVSQDEKESGLRSLLNLGHTLAHAIETLSGYQKFHHGEAVSCGLVYAALLSAKRGYCSENVEVETKALLAKFGLPIKWPFYPKKKYQKMIAVDKKAFGSKVNFVALSDIGKTFLNPLTPEEITEFVSIR